MNPAFLEDCIDKTSMYSVNKIGWGFYLDNKQSRTQYPGYLLCYKIWDEKWPSSIVDFSTYPSFCI